MREELAKINGERKKFKATFKEFNCRTSYGYLIPTLLLINVIDIATGKIVTDHLWFRNGKKFQALQLKPGEIIEFEARVDSYWKGYIRRDEGQKTKDYHLEYPTKLRKIVTIPSDLLIEHNKKKDDFITGLKKSTQQTLPLMSFDDAGIYVDSKKVAEKMLMDQREKIKNLLEQSPCSQDACATCEDNEFCNSGDYK